MTKKEKLEKLDSDVLDKMLEFVADGDLESLPLLSNAISYLKANEITSEREKDTREDEVKNRIKDANDRRQNKHKV